jgi:ketosteroid isomerase-like protein
LLIAGHITAVIGRYLSTSALLCNTMAYLMIVRVSVRRLQIVAMDSFKDPHMKRFLSFTGILVIACLMQACAGPGERSDQMVEAAKQIDQRYSESFSNGDVDGVMALYWNSPDLVVYPPDQMQIKGWDAERQALADVIKSLPGAKLELMDPQYLPVGNAVIGWGLWKLSFPNSHGTIPDTIGRYTTVSMKKDGKWVVIHDHISQTQPLATKS